MSTSPTPEGASGDRRRRRRVVPLIWLGSFTAAILVALSVTGSISGFTASITNSANSVGTGTLSLEESTGGGAITCSTSLSGSANTDTCTTINKYGNNNVTDDVLYPGASISTSVTLTNTGTSDGTVLTLTPGACTDGQQGTVNGGGSLCGDLQITLGCAPGSTAPTAGTAEGTSPAVSAESPTALATAGPITVAGGLAAGASVSCTFEVALPSTAGNADQYLLATQPLVWTLES